MRVSGDLCLLPASLLPNFSANAPHQVFDALEDPPLPRWPAASPPAGNSAIGKSDSIPSSLVSLSSMNSIGSAHADRSGAPAHSPA